MNSKDKQGIRVIIGLGVTGLSCARFCAAKEIPFVLFNPNPNPANIVDVQQQFPNVEIYLGELPYSVIIAAREVILSPGVPRTDPHVQAFLKRDIPVVGDIELFCRYASSPIVAITGSNGKSTVTTLMGHLARCAGINVQVGGNLGVAALDILQEDCALYVLELSSFQLESTFSLRAAAATVLNLSPDHMDRYADLDDYARAKKRIYQNCEVAICNKDEPELSAQLSTENKIYFTAQEPGLNEFGLRRCEGKNYLAYGQENIMALDKLPLFGKHNWLNAAAALALGKSIGLNLSTMIVALESFTGLPHRCQLVVERDGIRWINDSKATNVSAAIAAIVGLQESLCGNIILIAGGDGKAQDFSPLTSVMDKVKTTILLGKDALTLAKTLEAYTTSIRVESIEEAVRQAACQAVAGDVVLLSPACSSLDMFKNFEERGERFSQSVMELA